MKEKRDAAGDSAAKASTFDHGGGLLFGQNIPLASLYGLLGVQIGGDRATVRLPYRHNLTNSRGDIHGGAIAMLFDSALACAVRSHEPQRFGVVTIDLSTHFLSACSGDVVVHGYCERRGQSLCFARGEARDDDGKLLALATGTFKLIERPFLRVNSAAPVPFSN